jgi:hypothetical protein
LSTSGRKSPDDVPSLLDVWIALDGSLALRVMTDEDNHHTPDEDALSSLGESEPELATALQAVVAEFCGRYGFASPAQIEAAPRALEVGDAALPPSDH